MAVSPTVQQPLFLVPFLIFRIAIIAWPPIEIPSVQAKENTHCAYNTILSLPLQLLYGTKNRLAYQAVFYMKISSEYPITMNFAHNIFYTSSHCHRGRDRCVLLLDLYVHKEYSPLFQTRQNPHHPGQRTRSLFH